MRASIVTFLTMGVLATAIPSELVAFPKRQSSVRASITWYGIGDYNGSGSCLSGGACGMGPSGPSVAISQNVYGAPSGAGRGPTCGTCWQVTADSGATVKVVVDNLCPADGNPLCAMPTTNDVNAMGANVHFDLCKDSGATAAIFPGGNGATTGTAIQVPC